MGLAGRKQKQRIPADPRNLSWADDASRFGLAYLSKLGWDASQGLGSSGDGVKSHIKVQQKLDMMGIGAQHQRDPDGIAWKQNKDFEALLKRLNENAEKGNRTDDEEGEGEHRRGPVSALGNAFVRAQEEGKGSSVTDKKRKRGHDSDVSEHTKKRPKKEKEKRGKSNPGGSATSIDSTPEPWSVPSIPESRAEAASKPRPMAHRARLRAAKRIADKSASAIAEILGIAPSPASTSKSTPVPTPPLSTQPSLSLDNLTTSTKSVADYFKEKLLARSSSSPTSSSAPSGSATPGLGTIEQGSGVSLPEDEDELPRRGIGSQTSHVPPPSQTPPTSSISLTESRLDGRDTQTEKQRRKAERKAERRKRRESEASKAIPESVSAPGKEQMEGDVPDRRTSKEERKRRITKGAG